MPKAFLRSGSGAPVKEENWEKVAIQSKVFLRWVSKNQTKQKKCIDMEVTDDGLVRATFSLSDWVDLEFEDKWKGRQLVDEFRSNRRPGGGRGRPSLTGDSRPQDQQLQQEQQEEQQQQSSSGSGSHNRNNQRPSTSSIPSSNRASMPPTKKPKKRLNDDFGAFSSTLPTVGAYATHANLKTWEPKPSTASRASAGPVLASSSSSKAAHSSGAGGSTSSSSSGSSGLYRAPSASLERSLRNSSLTREAALKQQRARQEADSEPAADSEVVNFDSPENEAEADGRQHARGRGGGTTESLQTPPTSKRPFDRISEDRAQEEDANSKRRSHLDSFVVSNSGTPEKSYRAAPPGSQAPRPPAKRPGGGLINLGNSTSAGAGDLSLASTTSSAGLRSREPAGLQNLGNTCYMNAVLQAFASQREFVEDLLKMPEKFAECQDGPIFTYSAELLSKLSKLENRAGPLNPAKLRERIAANCPMFKGFKQQDAHEFLLEYSNQLHDELIASRREALATRGMDLEQIPQGFALSTETYLDSQVEKTLVCSDCGASHAIFEQFRDFSLDFTQPGAGGGNVCRLTDMLRSYFSPEAVEAQCETCKARNARLGKKLTHAPRTLILHMKRFVPNLAQQRYEKQHQRVEFPDVLDLRKVLSEGPTAASKAASADAQNLLNVARPFLRREPSDSGALTGHSSSSSSGLPPPPLPPPPGTPPSDAEDAVMEPVVDDDAAAAPAAAPELSYKLRSVVTHNGASPHSGHYVCYGRGADERWRLFDDSSVREMPSDFNLARLGSDAYILFYALDRH
mmetsp:Transcript_20033/g.43608  ORF Transcript_20033/g.43608 Transcript_20033/m.43608 type:complete len:796 (+) Transcript_20033:56-2443(+)